MLIGCNSSQPESFALFIKEKPIKETYVVGEELDLSGLVVQNQKGEVVDEYLTSIQDGEVLDKVGNISIEISKPSFVSTFLKIRVNEKGKSYLEIDSMPNKLTYNIGDQLNLQGLKVTCEDEIIEDYTVTINGNEYENGYYLTDSGSLKVFVNKEGYERNFFTILVNDDEHKPTTNKRIYTYYINDTHGAFIRQNTDSNYYELGMSAISSYLIDKKKSNPENTIILSGGDMFQGGIESNHTKGMIFIDAMNHAGFDAMVVGNHDFDWGERALKNFAIYSDFAYISCNIFYSDKVTRPSYLEPYTVIYRDGVKIGIIGGAIEDMGSDISGSISSKFYFPDPEPYVKQYSDYLRNNIHCDLVFALFHDGGFYGDSYCKFDTLTQISPISGERYVDAFYFAHDHKRKTGNVNGVPYIESACNGRIIGEMSFDLSNNTGFYTVSSYSQSCSYRFDAICTPDDFVDNLLVKYSYLIPDPDEILTIFSRAYTREEFLIIYCRSLVWYVNNNFDIFGLSVNFSCANYGGIRASVDAGEFRLRDLEKIIPFDNCLAIQKCTPNNINNMKSSTWVDYYQEGEIKYESGFTYSVTVSFICESETAMAYFQQSYEEYSYIMSKDVVAEYLKSGVIY